MAVLAAARVADPAAARSPMSFSLGWLGAPEWAPGWWFSWSGASRALARWPDSPGPASPVAGWFVTGGRAGRASARSLGMAPPATPAWPSPVTVPTKLTFPFLLVPAPPPAW